MQRTTLMGLTALAFFPFHAAAQAFQPPLLISDVPAHIPNGVEMVDLDQDGDLDLVGIALNEIVWFENDGTGGFGTEQLIDNSVNPSAHHLVDINGDGLQDLLVSAISGDVIVLYYGNGNTFDAPITVATPDNPKGLFAADLNADGHLDVLYAARLEVGWLPGDSTGSFGTPQIVISAPFSSDFDDVTAADLDGDSDVDFAYTLRNANKVAWHRNLGGGTFGVQDLLSDNFPNASALQTADLDLDGDVEFVVHSDLNTSLVGYYDNLGSGNFSARVNLSNSVDGPLGMRVADVTGNGYPEIVLVSYLDKEVLYFPNDSTGPGPKSSIYVDPVDRYVGMALGDVDGDGFDDIVAASEAVSPSPERYQWFRNARGGCSAIQAPSGLGSVTLSNRIRLGWDAVDQSVGCQINAVRTSPAGLNVTRNYPGAELDQLEVPFSVLGNGTSWDWRVRCACSTTPLEATPFSAFGSFSVPTARAGTEPAVALSVFPNPASERVRLKGEGTLRIVDATGRTAYAGFLDGMLELGVADWPTGLYVVEMDGERERMFLQR